MHEETTQARGRPLARAAARKWTGDLRNSADGRSPRRSVDAGDAVAVGAAERDNAKAGLRADDDANDDAAFVVDVDGSRIEAYGGHSGA
jgi:hypothetical protein